tara:strand:+ start:371 stop:775 length:405 start_codon:yes stop_codon:yes gene_type:complete
VDRLIAAATEIRLRAHAPYSGFLVGAALESSSGEMFVGCNVENASYGLCVCAERNAVAAAVAAGVTDWQRLAVVVDVSSPVAPCGACRQVLAEFCEELDVLLVTTSGIRVETRLSELLPRRFDGSQLDQGADEA